VNTFRKAALSVAIASLLAVSAGAQKHPNLELGFKADKLYQLSDLDSVNLYNGNLMIRIPIGIRYPANADFAYQLGLVYNSKVWDYRRVTRPNDPTEYYVAVPNSRSNAGLGWRITMGRLLPPLSPSSQYAYDGRERWIYEGADGSEHAFGAGPTVPSPPADAPSFSEDEPPLRMRQISSTERAIEFPTGEVHTFRFADSRWRLDKVADRFNNSFTVHYQLDPADASQDSSWTITDSLPAPRSHVITFTHNAQMHDTVDHGQIVNSISVAGANNTAAVYQFTYTTPFVTWGCQHTDYLNAGTGANLPLLTGLALPDGSNFAFTYHNAQAGGCDEGALASMKVPTGGVVSYEYRPYELPESMCYATPIVAQSLGVYRKTTTLGPGQSSTWDYVHDLGPQIVLPPNSLPSNLCGYHGLEADGSPAPAEIIMPRRWARTSVLSPAASQNGVLKRTRSDNFFYAWTGFGNVADAWGDPYMDLGRPVTSGAPSNSDATKPYAVAVADVQSTDSTTADRRFLSTRVMDGCLNDLSGDCTGGALLQSSYSRFTFNIFGDQIDSSSTVYNDDTACPGGVCFTRSTMSDPDGVGHFRSATQTSSLPGSVTSTDYTNYVGWSQTQLLDASKRWLPNLFTEQWHDEGTRTHSLFCFNPNNGFLLRTRTRADTTSATAISANDVVTVYVADGVGDGSDGHGNVVWEKTYGGDNQNVAGLLSSVCTQTLPSAPVAVTGYSYSAGTMSAASLYDPATNQPILTRADYDIDPATGLVKVSRDAAGVATSYAWASTPARLTSVTSPGRAPISYTYANATSSANARVTISTVSGTGASATTITSMVDFDPFGRVLQKADSIPGTSNLALSRTRFDALGRVIATSEPQDVGATIPATPPSAPETLFEYDALGRKTKITPPDGAAHAVSFAYSGARVVTRTAAIATSTSGAESAVATSEEYDGARRRVKVTEKSGPTTAAAPLAANVVTEYGYAPTGGLASVKMTGAEGIVQNRIFSYDGRGFLRWESHPESGMTAYSYDALGKVLSKRQSAASTLFDLNYVYDAAGRLVRVDGRNPTYDASSPDADRQQQFRVMKEFQYATANDPSTTVDDPLPDLRAGKLLKATRYNFPPDPTVGGYLGADIVRVAETYQYRDLAGRRTYRTTDIDKATSLAGPWSSQRSVGQGVGYNDLDLPIRIDYPNCLGCGMPTHVRTLQPSYAGGRLATVPGFVSSMSYWPNGMRRELVHSNSIVDLQTVDDSGMARPKEISSNKYKACDAPTIVTEPQGGTISGSTPLTLTVSAVGTALSYQWHAVNSNGTQSLLVNETSASLVVHPSVTTQYYVDITNLCGMEAASRLARVSVNECAAPTAVYATAAVNRDWTVTLSASDGVISNPYTDPMTFSWFRAGDNAAIGTGAKITTAQISVSTGFYVKATNACSSTAATSSIVSVQVPLPSATGLIALKNEQTQIVVSWPAVAGATKYILQRRSGGSWSDYATLTAQLSFTDSSVTAGKSYAYRMYTLDSNNQSRSPYSNADVATIMTFTNPGGVVQAAYLNEVLQAVNAVRAAAGWAAVTWADILAPDQPTPAPSALITGAHILAPRARMNEALQALGVPVSGYTDPDLRLRKVQAFHIAEIEGRAQ
jgi:hypothetical protein